MKSLRIPWEILPVWHKPEQLAEDAGSRDPLGFQRIAAAIADELLPNITVLTRRARYYSYICWFVQQIWEYHEGLRAAGQDLADNDYAEILARFERFQALAEALFHDEDEENSCSWVGIRGANNAIRKYPRKLHLDIPLSKDEGGNGIVADYRQSLQKLGFFSIDENNNQYPLTESGKMLADAFHQAAKGSKGAPDKVARICCNLKYTEIDRDEIRNSAKAICLSEISPKEIKLIAHVLFGGKQYPVVEELKYSLDRRRNDDESKILSQYFQSSSSKDIAFVLKQNSFHQLFALACLAILKGIMDRLDEDNNPALLGTILGQQLKKEKISSATPLSRIVNRSHWDEEWSSLQGSDPIADWISRSLRLLYSISLEVSANPALVRNDIEGYGLVERVFNLLKNLDHPIKEILFAISTILVEEHCHVHESKRKNPWIHLNGNQIVRDVNAGSITLSFPPNTIRLRSLISLNNDLRGYHA